MLLGMLAMFVWMVWFGTKTMYVMPLIADRGCSFLEAFTESWRLTKTRFWELFVLYFLVFLPIALVRAPFADPLGAKRPRPSAWRRRPASTPSIESARRQF